MITKTVLIKNILSHFNLMRSSLFFCLLFLSCIGCGGSKDDTRGERLSVSGLVYYDGDPITSARILFISETSEGKVKSAGIVRQGIYNIPEQGGPVVGKARVEIYPTYPELEELEQLKKEAKEKGKPFQDPASVKIPAAYNKNSQLSAVVTKDGKNTFDFKIETK